MFEEQYCKVDLRDFNFITIDHGGIGRFSFFMFLPRSIFIDGSYGSLKLAEQGVDELLKGYKYYRKLKTVSLDPEGERPVWINLKHFRGYRIRGNVVDLIFSGRIDDFVISESKISEVEEELSSLLEEAMKID